MLWFEFVKFPEMLKTATSKIERLEANRPLVAAGVDGATADGCGTSL
jgi:hypothetical protein